MSNKLPKFINRTAAEQARNPKKLEKYFSTNSMIVDALNTLGNEVQKIRVKSHAIENSLEDKEIRTLTEIIKTLVLHEKHEFELSKSKELTDKLEAMTDGELLEYAKTLVAEENETASKRTKATPSSNQPNTADLGIQKQIEKEAAESAQSEDQS